MSRLAAAAVLVALAACGAGEDAFRPQSPLVPTPEEAFRRTPPRPAGGAAFEPPRVEASTLENGLTVMLLPRPGAALAAVTLVTRRGGEDGPAETAGLSWLLGQALLTGTTSDAPWGAFTLEREGISADVLVRRDRALLTATLPSRRLEEVLPVLAEVATRPTLAEERVEEVRRQALSRVDAVLGVPDVRVWHEASRLLHGEGSRWSLPIWGSAAVLRSASRQVLAEHHGRTWVPGESALVVAGDLDPERVREVVARAFGPWAAGSPPAAAPPAEPPSPFAEARLLAVASRSRSADVVVMDRGPSRLSPDSVPFALLAGVLGGMFASRLNLALREERGSSYGVSAVYDADRHFGELAVVTHVSQDRVGEALLAIVAELARLRDEGPAEEELETARALSLGRLAADFESSSGATMVLADLFAVGRRPENLAEEARAIGRTSAAEVREVAARWLRPSEAPIVVAGDLDVIVPALRDLGLGPVAVAR